ncbi:MAG: DUF427 domain-containing protein [Proteobacteria bacterium]|nr:DUF427 domain-containing protein [Pseudomonadota bacterium]
MAVTESPANKRFKGLKVAHPGRIGDSHAVIIEPSPRRVRVMFNGETIADSSNTRMLHEDGHLPMYYFPMDDVRMDLLEKTSHTTHCPYKGDASYWTVRAGGRAAENAVWGYEDPLPAQPALKDLVAFYWGRMDHWFEEDEEIFVHPRDPYKRIDTIKSSRRVQVTLGGEVVADSTEAVFLFETGLPTRYYIPRTDITAQLTASSLETACPYKGTARYHNVEAGGKTYEDIVWYYPDPIAEIPKIKDLHCFFNEKVDAITVDGQEIPKQPSPWSDG